MVHGSYKALSWSRDLAAKWVGLLAHYSSGVELEYLPSPVTPGPIVDFVHHEITSESMYAIALVIGSKVKPTVEKKLWELTCAKFENQDDDSLLDLSLKLYGAARFLEQVGRAQIKLMDSWLDPAVAREAPSDRESPRGVERNAGIYRDFWNLNFIVNSPEPLQAILKGFHAGTTFVEGRRSLPPFAELREYWQHALTDNSAGK